MRCLAICQTPLHLLITTIEAAKRHLHVEIIIVGDSVFAPRFLEWCSSLLKVSPCFAPGSLYKTSWTQRTLDRKKTLCIVKDKLINFGPDELLLFHDSKLETQYAIHLAKKIGTKVVLGEDGVAIYPPGGTLTFNQTTVLLNRVIFGHWWRPRKRIGLHPSIDEVVCCFPDLLSKHLIGKCVRRLSNFEGRTSVVGQKIAPPIEVPSGRYLLLLLPLFSDCDIDGLVSAVSEIASTKTEVVIKAHPRQSQAELDAFFSLTSRYKVYLADQGWPAEIYGYLDTPPSQVIGWNTSSLHIIHSLFPSVPVAFPNTKSDQSIDSSYREFLHAAGVISPLP